MFNIFQHALRSSQISSVAVWSCANGPIIKDGRMSRFQRQKLNDLRHQKGVEKKMFMLQEGKAKRVRLWDTDGYWSFKAV